MSEDQQKRLFIISPIGKDDSRERRQFDKVQKYLISRVCEPMGYKCIRADQLNRPGTITSQIVDCLIEYDLVVADLSTLNPNVFYELAIRHAVDKPAILIAEKGTDLPFDIKPERVIFYTLDYEDMERAQDLLKSFVESVESGKYVIETPVKSKITIERTSIVKDSELLEKMDNIIERLDKQDSVRLSHSTPIFEDDRIDYTSFDTIYTHSEFHRMLLRTIKSNFQRGEYFTINDLMQIFPQFSNINLTATLHELNKQEQLLIPKPGVFYIP